MEFPFAPFSRLYQAKGSAHDPEKHVPEVIRDGNRFPACAKPWHGPLARIEASAGEGRSDKIMRKEDQLASATSPAYESAATTRLRPPVFAA